MPEGPSLVILRQKVEEVGLPGKKIIKTIGNTALDLKLFDQQKILGFKTWGKHFLVCFNGFALRIHLRMFGTYRINEHKDVVPRIGFQFDGAELNFYTCDLAIIEGDLNKEYDWKGDIMADEWDDATALKKLLLQPERLLCDVLLDQEIFAGSGNIIKNEVLYRSKLHPLNTVGSISRAKLKEMVRQTRTYAFDFLEWRKAGVLTRHWEVYSKKNCPKGHLITKSMLGKNKRVTYYCANCQKLYK